MSMLEDILSRKKEQQKALDSAGDLDLHITEGAFEKMHLYQRLYEALAGRAIEFYGYLVSKTDEDVITNVHLPKKQRNTFTGTEIPGEEIKNAVEDLHEKGYLVRGWTHCHPHFSPNPSSTDRTNNKGILLSISGYNRRRFYTQDTKELSDYIEDGRLVVTNPITGEQVIFPIIDLSEGHLKNRVTSKKPHLIAYMHSLVISGDENNVYAEAVTKTVADSRSNIINPSQQVRLVKHKTDNDIALHESENMPQMIVDIINSIEISPINTDYIVGLGEEPVAAIVRGAQNPRTRTEILKEIKDEDFKIRLMYELGDVAVRREVLSSIRDKDRRLRLIYEISDAGIVDLLYDYEKQFRVTKTPEIVALFDGVKEFGYRRELYFRYGDELARSGILRKEDKVRSDLKEFHRGITDTRMKELVYDRYRRFFEIPREQALAVYDDSAWATKMRKLSEKEEEERKPDTLLGKIFGKREKPAPQPVREETRVTKVEPYTEPVPEKQGGPIRRFLRWLFREEGPRDVRGDKNDN